MGTYTVKNLKYTSDKETPNGQPWKEYWEAESGDDASECHFCGNTDRDKIVGAHVKLTYRGEWYIVPLCMKHNHYTNDDELTVKGPLVPVNPSYQIKR
jgi:hypothetical protein